MAGFSDFEADVCAVIEGEVAGLQAFGGFEVKDVHGVGGELMGKALFRLLQGGAEEGIAVAGEDDFPGPEVEGELAHVLQGDGEAVNHGIVDVLAAHGFLHVGNDEGATFVS